MAGFEIQNLVYLLLLLVVIIYFTAGSYKGNMPKALKHGVIWLAIMLALFVILRAVGY